MCWAIVKGAVERMGKVVAVKCEGILKYKVGHLTEVIQSLNIDARNLVSA